MAETAKLVNRVLHLTSTGFLTGTIVLNYIFTTNEYLTEEPGYQEMHITAGVLVFVTGILNIILISRSARLANEQSTSKKPNIAASAQAAN